MSNATTQQVVAYLQTLDNPGAASAEQIYAAVECDRHAITKARQQLGLSQYKPRQADSAVLIDAKQRGEELLFTGMTPNEICTAIGSGLNKLDKGRLLRHLQNAKLSHSTESMAGAMSLALLKMPFSQWGRHGSFQ
ncbi:MAG: hypothetical protein OIF57_17485 [Marinobacterium sp.]|nr:hypothetical protein [Marinobacterium sp.]